MIFDFGKQGKMLKYFRGIREQVPLGGSQQFIAYLRMSFILMSGKRPIKLEAVSQKRPY